MGTAVATLKDFSAFLERSKSRLAVVATKHMTPERIVKIAAAAASRNPKLVECTPESVLASLMAATQIGLEPGGPLQHAALIPRWNGRSKKMECQFQVMYQGYRELVLRSGNYRDMEARAVYEQDKFDVELGLTPKLYHKPYFGEGDRGRLMFVYSIAWPADPDALPSFEVMSVHEVEAIRRRSQSADSGPWVTDFVEMAKKTVVIRHRKILRLDSQAAESLNEAVQFEDVSVEVTQAVVSSASEPDVTVDTKTGEIVNELPAPKPKKKAKKKAKKEPEPEPEPEGEDESGKAKQLRGLRDRARAADILDAAAEQDIADVLSEGDDGGIDLWVRHLSLELLKHENEEGGDQADMEF